MTVLLASRSFFERCSEPLATIEAIEGPRGAIERVLLPDDEGDVRVAPDDLARVTVAFVSGDLRDRPELNMIRRIYGAVRRAPNLEWLHVSNVGTDDPLYAELTERGVVVSNSPGANSEPIAVTLLGAITNLARGFRYWAETERDHRWQGRPKPSIGHDLRGQTITIVGLGAIGQLLASFVRPLGMHVVGVRRTPAGAAEGVDEWVPPTRLAEVLPRTQWLVLATPLTDETRGMIDAAALALLPRGAHVLNVGRGPVLDEQAFIEAVRSGHLAGGYLDVFEQEPLPAESPLWDLPTVIVSPHESSFSADNTPRVDTIFLEELERWQRGDHPSRDITR